WQGLAGQVLTGPPPARTPPLRSVPSLPTTPGRRPHRGSASPRAARPSAPAHEGSAMSRPMVICHMHTLLNGKIDGIANPTSVGMRSPELYFDLFLGEERVFPGHRGGLGGSGTSRASLGVAPALELAETSESAPAGDFLAETDAAVFYFAGDRSGTLPWDRSSFTYFDVEAHIVEL